MSYKLRDSLRALRWQAEKRQVFWRDHLCEDLRGRLYHGLNLLLLGTRRESFSDPVWDSASALKAPDTRPAPESQIILVFGERDGALACRSAEIFNRNGLTKDQGRAPGPELRIPWISAELTRYSAPEHRLYFNGASPAADRRAALTERIASFAADRLPGSVRPPAMRIVRDLIRARLCRITGETANDGQHPDRICEAVADLYDHAEYEILLRSFILPDQALEDIMHKNIPETVMREFLDRDTLYEMLNTLDENTLGRLETNMKSCLKANGDGTAWLHFFALSPDDDAEFFVTGKTDGELRGWYTEPGARPQLRLIPPEKICQDMQPDVMFEPAVIKN